MSFGESGGVHMSMVSGGGETDIAVATASPF